LVLIHSELSQVTTVCCVCFLLQRSGFFFSYYFFAGLVQHTRACTVAYCSRYATDELDELVARASSSSSTPRRRIRFHRLPFFHLDKTQPKIFSPFSSSSSSAAMCCVCLSV
jgi:hypothetical protein